MWSGIAQSAPSSRISWKGQTEFPSRKKESCFQERHQSQAKNIRDAHYNFLSFTIQNMSSKQNHFLFAEKSTRSYSFKSCSVCSLCSFYESYFPSKSTSTAIWEEAFATPSYKIRLLWHQFQASMIGFCLGWANRSVPIPPLNWRLLKGFFYCMAQSRKPSDLSVAGILSLFAEFNWH